MQDWTVLDLPDVQEKIDLAARRVAARFGWEPEDLRQEAVLIATDPTSTPYRCFTGQMDPAYFRRSLEHRLVDLIKYEAKHRIESESLEQRYEGVDEEYAPIAVVPTAHTPGGLYDRQLVESLLPAVWDPSFAYGVRVENAPDPDMPRGTVNKATGNTLGAHIADIKLAWEGAPLYRGERQALFLTYAVDWTQAEAGYCLGVTQQAISSRLYSGVGKVVAYLNGDRALGEYLIDSEWSEVDVE